MGEAVIPAASDRPLPRVVRAVVVDALRVGVGAALPTNAHYGRSVGATAGTIQRAMAVLAEQGALSTSSWGARGRRVERVDVGRAWTLAGLAPLRLLLPPGGSAEVDVLADMLTEELTGLGLPHTVRHRRGAARRLDAALAGDVDVAIVSSGVVRAGEERLAGAPTRILEPGTYYAPGRLVAVERVGAPGGARVAIDRDSPDHVLLTETAFPSPRYVHVECPFPDVPAAVLRETVDTGVWHLSHSVIPLDLAGLACVPLGEPAVHELWSQISAAALVASPRRPELGSAITAPGLAGLRRAQEHAISTSSGGSPDTP